MINNKKVLGIVPARGGSKRIPNKNIIDFCGAPLINATLKSSLNSIYIDKIVVSTDDKKISTVVREFGVEVIDRPANISGDHSPSIDAVLHVFKCIKKYFDVVILLQPTSPLRSAKDIDNALEYHQEKKCASVISVCEAEYNIQHVNILPDSKNMKNFINNKNTKTRTQDLEKYYRLNGAIYVADTSSLLKTKTFFMEENSYAYEMSNIYSVDIDNEIDLKIAEFIYKNYVS